MNTLTKLEDARLRAGLSAAALLLALALAGCGGGAKDEHAGEGDKHAEHAGEKKDDHSEAESELTLTSEEAARAGIKVEEIKPQALGETLTVTATIRPDADRLAHVAARIEGRITSAPAKLGDQVRAGQTLATLDSVDVGEAHAAWVAGPGRTAHRRSRLQARRIVERRGDHPAQGLPARQGRSRQGGRRPACRGRPAAPARRLAQRQRQRRLGLRGDGALCRHGDREEGHAGRTGQPERADVQRRRPEPRVDPGRPAGKRAGQGAHRRQRQGDGAGLSERGLQRPRRPHRRLARQGHAHRCGAHRGGQCRWPAEAGDVRHRHHRGGRRQARGDLAARRRHRADGRQADGLRLRTGRV